VSRQTIIQGAVRIGKGTSIGPNTVITGPVFIGNDCTIGPNCCILPNTSIGSRVSIEPFTSIGDSLIMDDSVIGSHSLIKDTVLGERGSLADHTSASPASGLLEIEGWVTRSEFGAVFGDSVKGGSFSLFHNSVIGNNVTIEEQACLKSRNIPDDSMVM
jgi:glucose-1-phosphate thymidylyltransferase